MKFGQLIEYNMRNIFLKNHAENVAGVLASDFSLCFKKAFSRAVQINACSNYNQNIKIDTGLLDS